MLSKLVLACIRFRLFVLAVLVLLLGLGVWALKTLPIDALPDVSNVQVDVITEASGGSGAGGCFLLELRSSRLAADPR